MYTVFAEINPGHCHIDFVYYALTETYETEPNDEESKMLKWYNRQELKNEDSIQENILLMALEALDLLNKQK